MALDLGELSGRITLDAGPAETTLAKFDTLLRQWGASGGKGAKAAAAAGLSMSGAIAAGIDDGGREVEGSVRQVTNRAADEAEKGSGKIRGAFSKMGGATASFVGNLGSELAIAGVAAVKTFVDESVTAASDMQETLSKSRAIFGDQASAMESWANKAPGSFGLAKSEALAYAAGLGDLARQLNFSGEDAAAFSRDMVQVAGDLGSFNNLETDDVLERITSALRGEYDSLQAIIPNINAARVEQEALALSGKKTAKELTEQDKVLAIQAILHKDGARAMGDFAKTSGGFANQQKIAAAQVQTLQERLGQVLLPILTQVMNFVTTTAVPALAEFADEMGPKIGPAVEQAGKFLEGLLPFLGQLATFIAENIAVLGPLTAGLALLNIVLNANPISLVVLALGALVAGLMYAYQNSEEFRRVVDAAMAGVQIAIGWVVTKAGEVQAWFGENWPKVQALLTKPIEDGVEFVQDHIQFMADKFVEVRDFVTKVFSVGWKTAESIIKDPVGAAKKGLDVILGRTGLQDTFNGAKNFLTSTWKRGWSAAESVIKDPVGSGKKAVDALLGKTGIRDTFNAAKDWVGSTWKRGWSATESFLKDPVGAGKDAISTILGKTGLRSTMLGIRDWMRDSFQGAWSKVKGWITAPIDGAKDAVEKVLGKDDKSGLRGVFSSAVSKIGDIWDDLEGKMKAPVKWAIDNVLNGGLIAAYNWIADKLPGVGPIDDIKIPGYHDGGYTGNIDPNKIAGVVHGDEEVIKSASRRSFESKFPGFLKYINDNGDLPVDVPGYADGGRVTSYKGHRFTELFVAGLKAAEKIAGESLSIYQGGFRPTTSYSGTSHAKDAIDFQVSYPLIAAMRAVGIPSWDRTGKGPWMPHSHGVPLPGHGFAGGSAVWQAADYLNGGDGLGGKDNGPRPSVIDSALGGLKDFVGGIIDDIKAKITGPLDKLNELGGTAWAELVKAVPKSIADQVIDFVKKANPLDLIGIGGYANGAWSTAAGIAAVSEDGRPELVVGPQLRRFKQGQTVLDADETAAFMRGQIKVEIPVHIDNVGWDADRVAAKMQGRVQDSLAKAGLTTGGFV